MKCCMWCAMFNFTIITYQLTNAFTYLDLFPLSSRVLALSPLHRGEEGLDRGGSGGGVLTKSDSFSSLLISVSRSATDLAPPERCSTVFSSISEVLVLFVRRVVRADIFKKDMDELTRSVARTNWWPSFGYPAFYMILQTHPFNLRNALPPARALFAVDATAVFV